MFPPIQLNKEVNKVVPYKYWWNATRLVNVDNNTTPVQHDFMSFRDPVAPAYVVVGRPGNTEEKEQLSDIPYLERINQYTDFSMTLLHYPGSVAKKSLITVRQVDVLQGNVPMEFALEKTFTSYNIKEICNSMEGNIQNKYQLESSYLISDRKRHEKFLEDTIEFSIHNYADLEEKEPDLVYPALSKNGDMDKAKEFLLKEISITAGESSKIRALFHSYNLKREHPLDIYLDEMYKLAIKGVCVSNYQQILKNQTEWKNQQDWKKQADWKNQQVQEAIRQVTQKILMDHSNKPPEQKISNDNKRKKSATKKENSQPNVNVNVQKTMNPFQNLFGKNIFGTNKENVQPNFVAQNGPQHVFHFQAGANRNVKKEQNDHYFKNGTKIFGTNKENIQPTFVAQKPDSTKNVKKSASFAQNISTDIPQNLNTSSVNASSTTGGLKGILKVPLPKFPQTSSLKPVRVDTNTHVTADYSPQSLDKPNSPQVTYRINTQVKVDYEPQKDMKGETLKTTEKSKNKVEKIQEVKKRKRNFIGKVKWSEDELYDLTDLIAYFYYRALVKPSCDMSKFPLFKGYIAENGDKILEMNPNVAEKIISNDKADCVFIHYYKSISNEQADYGTLLDKLFSSKGVCFQLLFVRDRDLTKTGKISLFERPVMKLRSIIEDRSLKSHCLRDRS
ncbi:unnamed protein product [Meloidogyne enterolobii]|uniref:Uncharacterized protein n=1 Tax=Meloidogyne enterolobii TaxID=390850 RepID=A0ACB1B966_MELEN